MEATDTGYTLHSSLLPDTSDRTLSLVDQLTSARLQQLTSHIKLFVTRTIRTLSNQGECTALNSGLSMLPLLGHMSWRNSALTWRTIVTVLDNEIARCVLCDLTQVQYSFLDPFTARKYDVTQSAFFSLLLSDQSFSEVYSIFLCFHR